MLIKPTSAVEFLENGMCDSLGVNYQEWEQEDKRRGWGTRQLAWSWWPG